MNLRVDAFQQDQSLVELLRQRSSPEAQEQFVTQNTTPAEIQSDEIKAGREQLAVSESDQLDSSADKHSRNLIDITA